MLPLVSVVLCTYNQRAFLRDAIDSVLAQTYPRVELIVIDNGSQDGTRELLAEYGQSQTCGSSSIRRTGR